MEDAQEKYIMKQKRKNKKLLNCWVDKETILSLNSLKGHYQAKNRGTLINRIIKEHLKFLKNDKTDFTWKSQVDERLKILEKQVISLHHMKSGSEIPLEDLKEKIGTLPILQYRDSLNDEYDEEKLDNRFKELINRKCSMTRIASILNREGFRTSQGKKFNNYYVQKHVMKIKTEDSDN